jgi:ligand-binding SRPBCC domain-containing protein
MVLADTGFPHPAQESKPELTPQDFLLWDAYQEISAGRLANQVGLQPLPLSEIQAWMALTGEGVEDPKRFIRLMRRLDQVERKHYRAELEKQMATANKR